uniref:Gamma-synuclein n=1 Tax=Sinocyclocheilus rhinocerous TaxID=307959 RepID=A0A673LXU6_9TELE
FLSTKKHNRMISEGLIAITRMALPLFIWNFYLVFLYQSAISEEHFMFVSGNKTKEGMVSGVNTVAQRTTDQANIVGETAVGSTNEVGQKTVEGLENVAATTGLVNPLTAVSHHTDGANVRNHPYNSRVQLPSFNPLWSHSLHCAQ